MPDFKRLLFGEDVAAGQQRAANLANTAVETAYTPLQMKALIDALPALIRSQPKAQQSPTPEGAPLQAVSALAAPVIGLITEMSRNYEERRAGLEQHYPQGVQDALGGMRELAAQDPEGAAMLAIMQLFHGSPHRFSKFKHADEIARSGQGANTFGHGIYLAENPEVAGSYARSLAYKGNTKVLVNGEPAIPLVSADGAERHARDLLHLMEGNKDEALRHLDSITDDPKFLKALYGEGSDDLDRVRKIIRDADVEVESPARIYNVQGDFNPEDLLDWDRPLSEQSPKVRAALASTIAATEFKTPKQALEAFLQSDYAKAFPDASDVRIARRTLESGDMFEIADWVVAQHKKGAGSSFTNLLGSENGGAFYGRLSSLEGGQQKASERLRDLGVPGLRYLDQGSRALTGDWVLLKNGKPITDEGNVLRYLSKEEAMADAATYGGEVAHQPATRNVVWWGDPDRLRITHINDKPVGGGK